MAGLHRVSSKTVEFGKLNSNVNDSFFYIGGKEDRGYHRSHSDLFTSDSIKHINYLPIHDESQQNIDFHTELHHTNASGKSSLTLKYFASIYYKSFLSV